MTDGDQPCPWHRHGPVRRSATRAIRQLRPDPIQTGRCARSSAALSARRGNNQRTWSFIVARDEALRRQIGDLWKPQAGVVQPVAGTSACCTPTTRRSWRAPARCGRCCVWRNACTVAGDRLRLRLDTAGRPLEPQRRLDLPAVQNLMLAAPRRTALARRSPPFTGSGRTTTVACSVCRTTSTLRR
ncbi:MAG: hypothetical protein U0531_12765 [Dehalococcoidia bacterium]